MKNSSSWMCFHAADSGQASSEVGNAEYSYIYGWCNTSFMTKQRCTVKQPFTNDLKCIQLQAKQDAQHSSANMQVSEDSSSASRAYLETLQGLCVAKDRLASGPAGPSIMA